MAKIAKMTKNNIFDFFGCVLREENNSVRTQNGQNGQNDQNNYFRKNSNFCQNAILAIRISKVHFLQLFEAVF